MIRQRRRAGGSHAHAVGLADGCHPARWLNADAGGRQRQCRFRNVIGIGDARRGEPPTRVKVSAGYRQGLDLVAHPRTQGRPRVAVPFRNIIERRPARRVEPPTRVEVGAKHRQGVDPTFPVLDWYPHTQSGPRNAIPFCHVRGRRTARRGETATRVEVGARHHQRRDTTIAIIVAHPRAEGGPPAAVPFRNVRGHRTARRGENATRVKVSVRHRQRKDVAIGAHPRTQGGPRVAIPFRNVRGRCPARGGKSSTRVKVTAGHR